jgi:uncharacterized protein
MRRPSVIAIGVIVAVIVLLIVVQALAGFDTNYLWFHYQGVGEVWRAEMVSKIGLALVFIAISFALIWVCLLIVDKVAPRAMFMAPDSELVRRYQAIIGPRAVLFRSIVALLVALAVGSGTASQWQHWILFTHTVKFGILDPQFHRDVSFFVDQLPFLSFLVDWVLSVLLVALVVSIIAYFLNGAIRLQAHPRIEPRALAHVSLIGCLMALVRAWAYYYVDRFTLDLSSNGPVTGASYTDVNVRLPAMTLLAVISLAAFVLLAINIYQRTLVLPAIAFGLWVVLALLIGVIYPALVQAFKVTPAQSTLEKPYISRNITATQQATGIASVQSEPFAANQDLTPSVLDLYSSTLNDAVLWDPTFSQATFSKLQTVRSYFDLTDLNVDRYDIDGQLTPVDIGVRGLNTAGIPTPSWVNLHLQYTHGYGAVVAAANTGTSDGNPVFSQSNLPPVATAPDLKLTQPAVYFAPGQSNYVIANTKQPEFDYQQGSNQKESHYSGDGGIPLGSIVSRLAFAVHLRDFNLLVSSDITSHSRLIYVPDVRSLVQRALPFLTVDANPYAVIANGQIDWVVDAYTTSSYYPYAEPEPTSLLPSGSGLAGDYNYVRDAVKVVVNAYTGKMSLYAIDSAGDPLIRSYEAAFPGLFQPLSKMPSVLQAHLRYPQDLLELQAATYGRYHVPSNDPSDFYSLSDAWDLSQTSTSASGSPSDPLASDIYGITDRYSPVYELLQLPGQSKQTFDALEPLVPYSQNDKLQTLAALMTADSDASNYGKLTAFVTPRNQSIHGPALATADIESNANVSKQISLLDTHGSGVLLGTVQILPIADSLLYIRPLFVSSSQTNFPQLTYVIVVYGNQVAMEPTLGAALSDVFGATVAGGGTSGPSSVPAAATALVNEAAADYTAAEKALASGDLGTYQSEVSAAGAAIAQAKQLLVPAKSAAKPRTSSASSTASVKRTTSTANSNSSA